MKKSTLILVFALSVIFSSAQTLRKGNLIGLHVYKPNLKEGVTIEAYANFFTSKVIPDFEKAFPGIKMYLMKSLRGADSSSMGVIYMFNTEADRNKYFKDDGTMTDAGKAADAKTADLGKEFDKYETTDNSPDVYNDWLVE